MPRLVMHRSQSLEGVNEVLCWFAALLMSINQSLCRVRGLLTVWLCNCMCVFACLPACLPACLLLNVYMHLLLCTCVECFQFMQNCCISLPFLFPSERQKVDLCILLSWFHIFLFLFGQRTIFYPRYSEILNFHHLIFKNPNTHPQWNFR